MFKVTFGSTKGARTASASTVLEGSIGSLLPKCTNVDCSASRSCAEIGPAIFHFPSALSFSIRSYKLSSSNKALSRSIPIPSFRLRCLAGSYSTSPFTTTSPGVPSSARRTTAGRTTLTRCSGAPCATSKYLGA